MCLCSSLSPFRISHNVLRVVQAPRNFRQPKSERRCPQKEVGGGGHFGSPTPLSGATSLPSSSSTPSTEHDLVSDARKKWNAGVLRCADAVVGALYGGGDKSKHGQDVTGRDNASSS